MNNIEDANFIVLDDGSVYFNKMAAGEGTNAGEFASNIQENEKLINDPNGFSDQVEIVKEANTFLQGTTDSQFYFPPSQYYYCKEEGSLPIDCDRDGGHYDRTRNLISYCYPRIKKAMETSRGIEQYYTFFDDGDTRYSNVSRRDRFWLLIGDYRLDMLNQDLDNDDTNLWAEGGINPSLALPIGDCRSKGYPQASIGGQEAVIIPTLDRERQTLMQISRGTLMAPEGVCLLIREVELEGYAALEIRFFFTGVVNSGGNTVGYFSGNYWKVPSEPGLIVFTVPSGITLDLYGTTDIQVEDSLTITDINSKISDSTRKLSGFGRFQKTTYSSSVNDGDQTFEANVYWASISGYGEWCLHVVPNGCTPKELQFTMQLEYVGTTIPGLTYNTDRPTTGRFDGALGEN